jgi:hypothetical protein
MGAKRSKNGGGVALFKKIVHVPSYMEEDGVRRPKDWFTYHDAKLPRRAGEYYMWIFHWVCRNGAVLEATRQVRPNGTGGRRNSWRHTVALKQRKPKYAIRQVLFHIADGWKEVFNGYTRPGTR